MSFILKFAEKEMILHESTAQLLSFEWSHCRISFTSLKVRATLYYIINSTTGKYCSVAFIPMVTL